MERANGIRRRSGLRGLIIGLLFLTLAVPSFAQTPTPVATDRAKRVVLVSILDRKLAVLEEGDVIATFSIAVGAAVSPSPTGEFQIISRVSNPTYLPAGHGDPQRQRTIPWGRDG